MKTFQEWTLKENYRGDEHMMRLITNLAMLLQKRDQARGLESDLQELDTALARVLQKRSGAYRAGGAPMV